MRLITWSFRLDEDLTRSPREIHRDVARIGILGLESRGMSNPKVVLAEQDLHCPWENSGKSSANSSRLISTGNMHVEEETP